MTIDPAALRHRPFEDILALLTGTTFVALGVLMFKPLGLLTGGTAGVAYLRKMLEVVLFPELWTVRTAM